MVEEEQSPILAGNSDIAFCDRIQEIIIITTDGRHEHLDRGISYGFCVEAVRTGVSLKELLKERVEPSLQDIKVKRWY